MHGAAAPQLSRRQLRQGTDRRAGRGGRPEIGGRFYLDFPCDLKPGEKVNVILSIHGAGSIGAWMRHYFPLVDYKEKYRLVIATPTSATANRICNSQTDDATLQNIVDLVFEKFGGRTSNTSGSPATRKAA